MRVWQFVSNGKIGDGYEREAYKELLSFLKDCTAFEEVWTIANVNLANTQLDLLILTKQGILSVDFKNYGPGKIYCTENYIEVNGEVVTPHRNIYEQALRQFKAIGQHSELKKVINASYIYSRILMCFRNGSEIKKSPNLKPSSKWFNCITPDRICSEIKNYDSDIGELTQDKIIEIIKYLGGESIDYDIIIDKIWDKLPTSPTVTKEERESGIYEEIFNKLKQIHDDIIEKELLARCEHAMALTTQDAHDTLPWLLKISKKYPNYEGYKNRSLLHDIFTYYLEYSNVYKKGKYKKDLSISSKMQNFIKIAKEKYGLGKLLTVVKETATDGWSSFGNSRIIWELVRGFYKSFPDDPDVIEWVFLGNFTEYPYFDEVYPEVVEKFFKNKELTRGYGLEQFNDYYDALLIMDGLFLLNEGDFLNLMEELKEYYPELKSSELFVDVISDYYLRKGEYEKAKSWVSKLDLPTISREIKRVFLDKLLDISWKQDNYAEAYRLATEVISQFSEEMSGPELSNYYLDKALALIKLGSEGRTDVSLEEVIENLQRAINANDSQYLHYLSGIVYLEKGDSDAAYREFTLSLKPLKKEEEKVADHGVYNNDLDSEVQKIFQNINWDEINSKNINIELWHIRWPIKGEEQQRSTPLKDSKDNKPPLLKPNLKDFQLTALNVLIELSKGSDRLKDLYLIIEDLKEHYEIPPEVYASGYVEFAEWIKRRYSHYLLDKTEKVESSINLDEVILSDNIKRRIGGIIRYVKEEGKPVSILLHGPPGCGKTMLAEAIANELGFEFWEVSPSNLLDPYVGKTEKGIGDTFKKAIRKGKVVLFFDELDAIAFSSALAERRWEISPINEMKIWLSKLSKSDSPVVFIGATNQFDRIDEALKRPGRFNWIIEIPLPGIRERSDIFKIEIERLTIEKGWSNKLDERDYEYFAEITGGFSGAHISNLVRYNLELIVASNEKPEITKENVVEAINYLKSYYDTGKSRKMGFIRKLE